MGRRDYTLEYLLGLNGEFVDVGEGYWIGFNAYLINPVPQRPHGIKYSLTLHGPEGERVLGYDNAHAAYEHKKNDPFDHIHRRKRIKKYDYVNAEKLMEDFFQNVEHYLKNKR